MPVAKCDLKLDWATHKAASYACRNWHYSECMPAGKMVKIGVWENNVFIGVVLFSCGASPPLYVWAKRTMDLENTEMCELTRVALNSHVTPVSRILKISFSFLKKQCPGIKCVISFADIDQDHSGGIYQAGNWAYLGASNVGGRQGYLVNGKKMHCRSVGASAGENSIKGARRLDPRATEIRTKGKHKYVMPLDSGICPIIRNLAKPYPKRVKKANSGDQSECGGAVPTHTLHLTGAA